MIPAHLVDDHRAIVVGSLVYLLQNADGDVMFVSGGRGGLTFHALDHYHWQLELRAAATTQ